MKIFLPIIAIVTVFFSIPALAQKKFTEGAISYDIVIIDICVHPCSPNPGTTHLSQSFEIQFLSHCEEYLFFDGIDLSPNLTG